MDTGPSEVGLLSCRRKLNAVPRRVAWYPGSREKAATFLKTFRNAEELGIKHPAGSDSTFEGKYIPWLFRPGLTPDEVSPWHPKSLQLTVASASIDRVWQNHAQESHSIQFRSMLDFLQIGGTRCLWVAGGGLNPSISLSLLPNLLLEFV